MAKHFKLRVYRVITATLQSCRSKDPSEDPVPSFSTSLNPNNQNHGHVLSTATTVWGLPPSKQSPDSDGVNELKWHDIAENYDPPTPRRKICSSSEDIPPFALLLKRRVKKNQKKNNIPSKHRVSISSADTGWFSNERDEEETETLVSSPLTFSTVSSTMRINKKRRVSKRTRRQQAEAAGVEIPARPSVFKKLIPCTVDGKMKESFAIVKRSQDPYEDFKDSMMDMILEKQMFDRKELEQLLQCFLSLNSRHYHGVIVHAFSEIWETIFSRSGWPAGVMSSFRLVPSS